MISLISSLSLKLYLNLLVYHRNFFGSSSEVFGHLQKFLEILQKCSGTFLAFETILKNLRKSLENHQKRRQCVYIVKRTLHVSSKI